MQYANPNTAGAVVSFKDRYDNFIGGEWIAPDRGRKSLGQWYPLPHSKTRLKPWLSQTIPNLA